MEFVPGSIDLPFQETCLKTVIWSWERAAENMINCSYNFLLVLSIRMY